MSVSRTTKEPSAPPARRGLNLHAGAIYIGVSYWTLRDYVLQGLIPTIDMPPLRPKEGARPTPSLRRAIVDVQDLDRFLESRKGRTR